MVSRRLIGGLAGALFALALLASPASAQFLDRGIQITGWAGPYAALGTLGSATQQGVPVGETKLEGGFALGGNVEVPIPVERLSLRANLAVAPSTTMETQVFFPCPINEPGFEFPDACRATTDGTLLTGTADLLYRTEQDITRPHGIFSIGFGLKRYSFDESETQMHDFSGDVTFTGECRPGDGVCAYHERFTGSQSDPTLHLGFGLSTTVGGVNLIGEVSDYVSISTSTDDTGRELEEMVHDIFVKFSAGVRIL